MGSFAKALCWELMGTISILLEKIWSWFFDCKRKTISNRRNRLFMIQLLSVIPECHIALKGYYTKETGGKGE